MPQKFVFWGGDPLNWELYQCNPQKAHPCMETRCMTYRSSKSVHWCDLCARLRNQKKTKNPNSGRRGICPDHPRRRIEIQFCMVCGIQVVVLSFKFLIIISSAVTEMWRVKIWIPALLWPMAYTALYYCIGVTMPVSIQLHLFWWHFKNV